MKRVLVPLSLLEPNGSGIGQKNFVRRSYVMKLCKFQLVPLLVSVQSSREVIDDLYQLADGVMLLGGDDVDPAHYGAERHPLVELASPELDQVEIEIVQRSLQDKKPLFGICRGAQVMNVACGGTLHQHLPDFARDIVHRHPDLNSTYEDRFERGPRHDILLDPTSRFYRTLGKDRLNVNSSHHQAVDRVGRGLRVVAHSPDGIVEAIEGIADDHFFTGVQAHAEAEEESPFDPIVAEFARSL